MLAVGALVLLALLGVVGVGRTGARARYDFDVYYTAGRAWLSGSSMYDPLAFTREMRALGLSFPESSLPYSPAFAPLAVAIGALPYRAAGFAMVAFNLVGVAVLCLAAIRLARQAGAALHASDRPATASIMVCIAAGLPCTANSVWLGQLSVWMAALTCAAWCARRERRTLLAGVLLGLTSIKPQFSLFLVLWLALEREWKVLLAAGVTALALSSYAMIVLGPLEPFVRFLRGAADYADPGIAVNSLGNVHVLGLPSLLATAGAPGLSVGPFIALCCAGVPLLWLARRRLHVDGVLALLLTGQVALVYAHDYELVFLVPAWAWIWTRFSPVGKHALLGLALMLVLTLPRRLFPFATEDMVVQARNLALLVLLWLVAAGVLRGRETAGEARPDRMSVANPAS